MPVLLPYGVTLYSMIDAYIKLTILPIYMESANIKHTKNFFKTQRQSLCDLYCSNKHV
jgi:hypothetical protein